MEIDSRDLKTPEQVFSWAVSLAGAVHYQQLDKAGMPYILHPIRVMMTVDTLDEQIVAVLHDVIEDGNIPESYLASFIGNRLAKAVAALSRQNGESYRDFILRVKLDPLATKVKIADLKDNLQRWRIPNPTEQDEARWRKYEKALKTLTE